MANAITLQRMPRGIDGAWSGFGRIPRWSGKMRGSEALFAPWRQLLAELCLEADRRRIDETADIATLVRSKQMLWRSELERRPAAAAFCRVSSIYPDFREASVSF